MSTTTVAKCVHGYFTHSYANRCPWCFGADRYNHNAVPVVGKGNGWLLRQGERPCKQCGGPARAGWGLLPEGMTLAQAEASRARNPVCYACTNR